MKKQLIILITCHNCLKTIFNTLISIEKQKYKNYVILLSEDGSNELINSTEFLYYQKYIPIFYWNNKFNMVSKNRNFLLRKAKQFSNESILLRCDSDDVLNNEYILRNVYKNFETFSNYRKRCTILLGSNEQKVDSEIIRFNVATNKLKKISFLLEKLFCMKKGFLECELPSSNFVYKNYLNFYYPFFSSAEDHFLLVEKLLSYHNSKEFRIDEDLIMINYSINGNLTKKNKERQFYLESRKFLFEHFKRRLNGL